MCGGLWLSRTRGVGKRRTVGDREWVRLLGSICNVSFGAVYGLIAMATQLSSGFGPLLIGALEDITGSYDFPLTLVAILTYAALIPIYFAKPPRMLLRRAVSRLITRAAPQQAAGGRSILNP